MKKLLLLMLMILLSSCDMSCTSKKEITEETFREFLLDLDAKGGLNQILSTEKFNENSQVGFELLTERFGELDENKISDLFKLDVKSLKRLDGIRLGKTAEAVVLDSVKMRGRRCGTYDSADSTALKAFSDNSRMRMPDLLPRKYFVPIEFHVISSKNSTWSPNDSDLKEQVFILNNYFEPLKVVFTVSRITRDTNNRWAKSYRTSKGNTVFDTIYKEMVETIKWENPSALHVYVNENSKVLGQASLPFENSDYQTKFDHVLISKSSMNNRIDPVTDYQMMGKTLVHEVGHFFGLLHTFHSNSTTIDCDNSNYNGCNTPGDYVSDTPPQRYCHFHGCGKCINKMGIDCEDEQNDDCVTCDTCTYDSEIDDVTNLMGYNPDSCINRFSPNQYTRMRKYFFRTRAYLISSIENLF